MRYLLLCLCALSSALGEAQDFRKDWDKALAVYEGLSEFQLSVSTVEIDNGERIENADYAVIIKKDQYWYSRSEESHVLMGDGYVLTVIPQELRVQYYQVKKSQIAEPAVMDMAAMDSVFDALESVSFLGNESGFNHYKIDAHQLNLNSMDVWFSQESGLVSKVAYMYDQRILGYPFELVVDMEYKLSGVALPFLREDILDMSKKSPVLKAPYDIFKLSVLKPEL